MQEFPRGYIRRELGADIKWNLGSDARRFDPAIDGVSGYQKRIYTLLIPVAQP